MAIGPSGRVVIEVPPELKRRLYAVLAARGITLKDWFLQTAEGYVTSEQQPSLDLRGGAARLEQG